MTLQSNRVRQVLEGPRRCKHGTVEHSSIDPLASGPDGFRGGPTQEAGDATDQSVS
jgi:hypothetical protein